MNSTICSLLKVDIFSMLLVIFAILPNICYAQSKAEEQTPKEITAESYWYNTTLGRVLKIDRTTTDIVGVIQARHGLSNFRVRRDKASDPQAKSQGLKMALRELAAWLEETTSRGVALSKLQELTGERFTDAARWSDWQRANGAYIVWSDSKNRFIIDEEAKRAGVPTDQYRKIHPWAEIP